MKLSLKSTLIYLLFIGIVVSCSKDINIDLYPRFSIPLFNNAFHMKKSEERDIFAESVTYSISTAIKPDEIFNFYTRQLQPKGFRPNIKSMLPNRPPRGKNYLRDGNWLKPPARYVMGWLNNDKTMVFTVTLLYRPSDPTTIICFLHPYADLTPLGQFTEALQKSGRLQEFMDITSKFKKRNGNFDLERAKKYEPKNDILKKYIIILEKDTEQLKTNYKKFRDRT